MLRLFYLRVDMRWPEQFPLCHYKTIRIRRNNARHTVYSHIYSRQCAMIPTIRCASMAAGMKSASNPLPSISWLQSTDIVERR